MYNTEQFAALIEELNILYQGRKEDIIEKQKRKEQKFLNFCNILRPLYEYEQKRINETYIKPFIEQNVFLKEKSILEIIKKQSHETYHSLLLKHLLSSPNILHSFIQQIENIPNKELLLSLILNGNYSVEEEVSTNKNKRIDLLITDNENGWLIAIENKIFSSVNIFSKGRTQLDHYFQYLKSNSKFRLFTNKVYILLSLTDNSQYTNDREWLYANYYQIFKAIIENNPNDAIAQDYLKTLYLLLFECRDIGENIGQSLSQSNNFYKQIILKIK